MDVFDGLEGMWEWLRRSRAAAEAVAADRGDAWHDEIGMLSRVTFHDFTLCAAHGTAPRALAAATAWGAVTAQRSTWIRASAKTFLVLENSLPYDSDALRTAARHPHHDVRLAAALAAGHRTRDVLTLLGGDPHPPVAAAAAANPAAPPSVTAYAALRGLGEND